MLSKANTEDDELLFIANACPPYLLSLLHISAPFFLQSDEAKTQLRVYVSSAPGVLIFDVRLFRFKSFFVLLRVREKKILYVLY